MKEYPLSIRCAGREFRCAWLFKMSDGYDAATYTNSTTRECLNAKWSHGCLEAFESSEKFMGQQIDF